MVYVLLGTGFEETEAIVPVDLLRRSGVEVLTVGISGKTVYGGHGIGVEADITLEEMDPAAAEMLVLPGGLGGVASISSCKKAMEAVQRAFNAGTFIAAICAAPTILARLRITDGKRAVCYPGCEAHMGDAIMVSGAACVRDGNVITGTSAGSAIPFALALIAALKGEEAATQVARQIVIR